MSHFLGSRALLEVQVWGRVKKAVKTPALRRGYTSEDVDQVFFKLLHAASPAIKDIKNYTENWIQCHSRNGKYLRMGEGGGGKTQGCRYHVLGECRGPRAPYALSTRRGYARHAPENLKNYCHLELSRASQEPFQSGRSFGAFSKPVWRNGKAF